MAELPTKHHLEDGGGGGLRDQDGKSRWGIMLSPKMMIVQLEEREVCGQAISRTSTILWGSTTAARHGPPTCPFPIPHDSPLPVDGSGLKDCPGGKIALSKKALGAEGSQVRRGGGGASSG